MVRFKIRGFRGQQLLRETVHKNEISAYVELEAWRARMQRGDIGHVELIDCRPGGDLTNLHVYAETEIPWSWGKR